MCAGSSATPCNLLLGLMKDNRELLRAAADYLEADAAQIQACLIFRVLREDAKPRMARR